MSKTIHLSGDQIWAAIQDYIEDKHLVDNGSYNVRYRWSFDEDDVSLEIVLEDA